MVATLNEAITASFVAVVVFFIGARLVGNGEFLVRNDWLSVDPYMRGRMNESESLCSQWINNKQIPWEETITDGLENVPEAFIDLFKGANMGKALVRLSS